MEVKEEMVNTLKAIQEMIQTRELPPLLPRAFSPVASHQQALDKEIQHEANLTFRVLQWNILAQALCQGDDNFVLCPPDALKWEDRSLRILEELFRYNASIYCLQEVDCFTFLQSYFTKLGFNGLFYPKPQSPCLDQETNYGPDGCAIFYDKSKFKLLDSKKVNLLAHGNFMTNQVALLCKFQWKANGEVFYVASTHLKARKGYESLRHEQGKFLLSVIKKEIDSYPLLLTGDFNAPSSEPIYKELVEDSLGLGSVYSLLSPEGVEPPFTTWQVRGTRFGDQVETVVTIDYIWYSKDLLKVQSILGMPEEIGEGRLPSYCYPSDHLSLVCDITLPNKESSKQKCVSH